MSKIIAINAGSSSLKFQLFEMPTEKILTKGMVERIGLTDGIFTIEVAGEKVTTVYQIETHLQAVDLLLKKLLDYQIVSSLTEVTAVGHRVAHGGEFFQESALIDEEVLSRIYQLSELAPLHNPANLIGIHAFQKALPDIPAVAVFDTTFHQTMPEKAFLYSIPYSYYQDYQIRKYGFHGTSHQYVAEQAAGRLKKPLEQLKLITCHIGNGASVTAIEAGKSIDTSTGFTPLEGLTMGTRSGNLDPAITPFLMKKLNTSAEAVIDIFNKQSGVLGISGLSSDLRDIEEKAIIGDVQAQITLDIYADRIKKHIGMYIALMNGVDAIVFTAGVGENSSVIRSKVLENMQYLGVKLDKERNNQRGKAVISTDDSQVKLFVIPTNEELAIARDVARLIRK